ncbi:glycosyltransferase family 4 protein [Treponema sp.]|uniref:glycosyltransferase family 4 protein n=1 Tax=Treponema sp. TaxID=166 RepID=UPI003F057C40
MIFYISLFSFVFSLVFTWIIIKICQRYKIYDEVDPRKIHSGNIPRLGGVAVFISFFVVSGGYVFFFQRGLFDFAIPVFLGFFLIFIFGFIDDLMNLHARIKFLVQIVAALLVALSPVGFHMIFFLELGGAWDNVITFFWILACINAFNLIDGIDWLCSGISFLSFITMGILSLIYKNDLYSLYFILSGSLAGFMFFNRPPAKIFLGDSGSQTLGFVIAVFPLLNKGSLTYEYNKMIIMFLIASIPLTDVIAAMWRRFRDHRSIFSADRAHIHHKMLNVGFSRGTTILFLLSLQILVCFSILLSCKLTVRVATAELCLFLCLVELVFITFHYLNHSVNKRKTGHLQDHPQKEH